MSSYLFKFGKIGFSHSKFVSLWSEKEFQHLNFCYISFSFTPSEEVEEESGSGATQEEYMKEQQAKLSAERQKLVENHDMVESVSTQQTILFSSNYFINHLYIRW